MDAASYNVAVGVAALPAIVGATIIFPAFGLDPPKDLGVRPFLYLGLCCIVLSAAFVVVVLNLKRPSPLQGVSVAINVLWLALMVFSGKLFGIVIATLMSFGSYR